jgi:phosphoribosylformylglycinamidine (FGAM) synthase PurS component
VIPYILKEDFVVEINGIKHEITFGKNRKGEIWQTIKYSDIENSNLRSYEVVRKGFTEGKWYTITDIDTSDEFKADYDRREEEYERNSVKEMYISILTNCINDSSKISEEDKGVYIKDLESKTYEELEELFGVLMKNTKENK